MRVSSNFRGQSAIEYLMTYGWMLLVVAVVGGAIFGITQDQGAESVTGFTGSNIQVDDFGVSSDGNLSLALRNGDSSGIVVSSVNVSDSSNGNWVYKEFVGDTKVSVGDSRIFELPFVSRSDSGNELNVRVLYDTGGLSNLSESGIISGNIGLTDTGSFKGSPSPASDDGGGDGGDSLVSPTANVSANSTSIESGQTVEFNASYSTEGSSTINNYSFDVDNDGSYEYSGSSPIQTHAYSTTGTYEVELNVSDSNGLSDTDKVTVDVSSTPDPVSWSTPHSSAPNCGSVSYSGSGAVDDPYNVTDDHQLQCIQDDMNAYYQLTQNINASMTNQWNGNKGFKPLKGPSGGTLFKGGFDGRGYVVTGLFFNRPNQADAGLFGYLEGGSTIKDIGLINIDINGGDYSIGGIVGDPSEGSNISNSFVTGKIEGGEDTGGIAGTLNGKVSNSYTNVTVVGRVDNVGGLAGSVQSGEVSNSYATGSVDGTGNVGGLVGSNYGDISDSYATADATAGGTGGGGLVGVNWDTGHISSSYATGGVTASSYPGGLVGYNVNIVSGSYWDTESTGQSSSNGGTGLTTVEMQGSAAESNMNSLEFGNTWDSVSSPDEYPVLQGFDEAEQLSYR